MRVDIWYPEQQIDAIWVMVRACVIFNTCVMLSTCVNFEMQCGVRRHVVRDRTCLKTTITIALCQLRTFGSIPLSVP